MIKITTLTLAALTVATSLVGQTQLPNPSFENLGNASPGVSSEPTGWFSNKSGSNVAKLGGQTCFQDNTIHHTGASSIRLETISYFGTAVNGSASTGVINAPCTNKAYGYIGTINYSTASDDRRYACTDRPDSIVGWYQYTPGDGTEQAKVRAILHTGDYNDPEAPAAMSGGTCSSGNNHPDLSANKVGDALFVSAAGVAKSAWTRFSVPFNYYGNTTTPAYIMVNITSSYNQLTSVTGSKFWIDDIALIYNPAAGITTNTAKSNNIHVFYADKNLNVDFSNRTDEISTLSIYDLTGKLVSSQKIENNKLNTVSLSTLNTGMYLYLISGTASQKAGKFIVD
ncbi:MAG: T9SS type A sorting domain-containing protein [Bacteroidia bacterium]